MMTIQQDVVTILNARNHSASKFTKQNRQKGGNRHIHDDTQRLKDLSVPGKKLDEKISRDIEDVNATNRLDEGRADGTPRPTTA